MVELPGNLRPDYSDKELKKRLACFLVNHPRFQFDDEGSVEKDTQCEGKMSGSSELQRNGSPDVIHFEVKNGHVRVEGEVTDPKKKRELVEICRRVAGVLELEDHLKVR